MKNNKQYIESNINRYKIELIKLIKQYPKKYSIIIKNNKEYFELYNFIEKISPWWLNGKHIKYKIANILLDDLSCFSKTLALRFYIDVNFIKINSFKSNFEKLNFIVSTFKQYLTQLKRYNNGILIDWINLKTPKLQNSEYTIDTKIYWILNNINDFPICDICKQNTLEHKNITSLKNGYKSFNRITGEVYKYTHCSSACAAKDPDVIKAYSETLLKKYGVKNIYQNEIIKEKIKKTNIEKYGVPYPMQNKNISKKAYETKKNNNSYITSIKKLNKTSLKKYNTLYPMQSNAIKNKSKINRIKTQYNKLSNNSDFKILFSFDEYLKNYKNKKYKFKFLCKTCNNIIYSIISSKYIDISGNKHLVRCKHCFPTIRCTSKLEIDIFNFCQNICNKFNYKIFKNYKKVLKINNRCLDADIVIPELKIIIEVNGTYFHSEEFYQMKHINKNIYRKIDKTIIAEQIGYELIHINEYEWNDITQQNIIKKYLEKKISKTFIFPNKNQLIIDREKHNKNDIPPNYKLIKEIQPTIITQNRLHIYNCGFLIYQKIT